jgi:hypothetical protein
MHIPARLTTLIAAVALLVTGPVPAAGAAAATSDDQGQDGRGLVALWNCEAPQHDRVSNCAGGGLNGTNHGARWLGGGLEFDGAGNYVSIRPHRKLSSLATGTLSVWFKAHSARFGDCVQPIFYYGDIDGGSDNSSLIVELGHFWPNQKTTALYFTIYGVPGQKPTFCFDTRFDLQLDTWYQFVAVVGNGFNTGYLNGVELTDRNYNFGGPNDTVFFDDVVNPGTCLIGKGWFWTFPNPCYFDGRIGEIRVYDRPLSARQVGHLYNEGRRDLEGDRTAVRAPSPEGRGGAGPAALLLQNHPNPFNPATRIRFSVAERTLATLRVYRVDGSLVATLFRGPIDPGVREVVWDGGDGSGRQAGSGVYFCQLQAGDQTITKKIVLGR